MSLIKNGNINKGENMKVTVEKYLDDKKIATATTTVASPEELQTFLGKLEIKRSKEDAAFDFDVYFEKTYSVYTESPDESEQLH
jgi:hypothetical protein